MPTKSAVVSAESELAQFVVTAGAVTIATGNKKDNGKPEVVRVLRGTIINAPADNPSIRLFLELRSIAPYVEGQAPKPATARLVCRAMGGMNDPVVTPSKLAEPVEAPNPSTT